jgi:hypothetical protein
MPKITVHGGPSYAGHVDASSPDTVAPEWAVVDEAPAVQAPAEAAEPAGEPGGDVKADTPKARGRRK